MIQPVGSHGFLNEVGLAGVMGGNVEALRKTRGASRRSIEVWAPTRKNPRSSHSPPLQPIQLIGTLSPEQLNSDRHAAGRPSGLPLEWSLPHPTSTQLARGPSRNWHFHARNVNCSDSGRADLPRPRRAGAEGRLAVRILDRATGQAADARCYLTDAANTRSLGAVSFMPLRPLLTQFANRGRGCDSEEPPDGPRSQGFLPPRTSSTASSRT